MRNEPNVTNWQKSAQLFVHHEILWSRINTTYALSKK